MGLKLWGAVDVGRDDVDEGCETVDQDDVLVISPTASARAEDSGAGCG